MADEHTADPPKGSGPPMTGADPTAPEHTRKADAGPAAPASQARDSLDHPANLNVRDVDRSSGLSGNAEPSPASEGTLYDRLAAKDQEPTEAGGDGPVP